MPVVGKKETITFSGIHHISADGHPYSVCLTGSSMEKKNLLSTGLLCISSRNKFVWNEIKGEGFVQKIHHLNWQKPFPRKIKEEKDRTAQDVMIKGRSVGNAIQKHHRCHQDKRILRITSWKDSREIQIPTSGSDVFVAWKTDIYCIIFPKAKTPLKTLRDSQ